MFLLHNRLITFIWFLLFPESLCICKESHLVLCEELSDINNNDTSGWRYVQIGTSEERNLHQVLNSSIVLLLTRTHSLTIINRINHILSPFLVTFNKLEHLNFYGNNIVEIDDYTFGKSPKLKEIYLENNNIQHLGQGLFQNTSLEVVNLSRNRITSITTCFYKSKIKWILLNRNRIRFIKSEAFPGNLEQLELNDNLLETVDNVFKNLKNLQELYLEGNHLTTIPDMVDLKQIRYLHFAYNKIKEVHYPFTQHNNLEFLDLSSNIIQNVTTHIFARHEYPPLVLLNFNRLINMVFDDLEKKTDLALYGNPWNCDCLFHIEQIVKRYNHMKTCEVNFFDMGQIPMCLVSGQCGGVIIISNSEIDNFYEIVKKVESDVKITCKFRL